MSIQFYFPTLTNKNKPTLFIMKLKECLPTCTTILFSWKTKSLHYLSNKDIFNVTTNSYRIPYSKKIFDSKPFIVSSIWVQHPEF